MSVTGMTTAGKDVASFISPIVLLPSTDDDVSAMLDIYRHHIAQGVGNLDAFEPTPFDADDLKARRKNMRKHRLPHLVATIDGAVAGYAYAVLFRKRPAYRFTVKHSIYVHPDRLHVGVGRALLSALIQACASAGFRQMIGISTAPMSPRCGCTKAAAFGRSVICARSHFGSANGPTR
jgi:phosphinothricin acetyltransferase